jgi:hypothetical protein
MWERREAAIMLTYGGKWVANALGFFYLYSSFCSKKPYWAVSTWQHGHTVPRCVLPETGAGWCWIFKWQVKMGNSIPQPESVVYISSELAKWGVF